MSVQPVRSDPFAYARLTKGVSASPSGQERTNSSTSQEATTRKEMLVELKDKLQKEQLELRLHPLPNSNVIIIRFFDPKTSTVVREFPSEHLAEALAEVRNKMFDRLTQSKTLGMG